MDDDEQREFTSKEKSGPPIRACPRMILNKPAKPAEKGGESVSRSKQQTARLDVRGENHQDILF